MFWTSRVNWDWVNQRSVEQLSSTGVGLHPPSDLQPLGVSGPCQVFILILPAAKRTRLEPGQHRRLLASPFCITKAFCH